MISNVILFNQEEFKKALESNLSFKRFKNWIDNPQKQRLNHVNSI